LVHFAVAGVCLLWVGQAYDTRADLHRIVVTPAHVAEIARRYALQFGGPPDRAVLEQLVRDDIRDEVLFRQAKALGLDRDDEIIRRRMVQKAQFLIQDLQAPAEPTDVQLQAYYAAHAVLYATPARTSFTHIFFAADKADPQARARAVLTHLPATLTRAPELGDPFPDLYDFEAYEPEQVARLFGHTPFTMAVQTAPVGRWIGPVQSAYGWHLLRVGQHEPRRQPPLAEVRDRVRQDYLRESQEAANVVAFDRLARRFTVVRADMGSAR
jgi:parvulin-like peptidyl-prolyl isomerase